MTGIPPSGPTSLLVGNRPVIPVDCRGSSSEVGVAGRELSVETLVERGLGLDGGRPDTEASDANGDDVAGALTNIDFVPSRKRPPSGGSSLRADIMDCAGFGEGAGDEKEECVENLEEPAPGDWGGSWACEMPVRPEEKGELGTTLGCTGRAAWTDAE